MAVTDRAVEILRRHLAAGVLGDGEREMVKACLAFIAHHPDCLWRTCLEGHLTGSAWIVSPDRTQALLLHHGKLNRWLQPGGHADGDPDLAAVALREAEEETGLGPGKVRLVSPELFDFDQHAIPARGAEPEHWHFDFRFLIEADPRTPLVLSDESRELRWFPRSEIAAVAPAPSITRMVRKT